MAGKLDLEARMAIKALTERGSSASSVARSLGVTEGAVRYHLRRQAAGAVDGRAGKPHIACSWHEAIATWLAARGGCSVNLVALHAWLVEEQGYTGSARSVQRYLRAAFPRPASRPAGRHRRSWSLGPRIRGHPLDPFTTGLSNALSFTVQP